MFAEPWEAQVFALTVHLSQQGHFTWSEWTQAFGATLRQAAASGHPDDGSSYYRHWLATLERILIDRGAAEADALEGLKAAWEEAYRTTPHGKPVSL